MIDPADTFEFLLTLIASLLESLPAVALLDDRTGTALRCCYVLAAGS